MVDSVQRLALLLLVVLACPQTARSMMYDIIEPEFLPGCGSGCADWSSLNATVKSWFARGEVPEDAGGFCAQLANAPGLAAPSPLLDPTGAGGNGAFCFCRDDTSRFEYCNSPLGRPEQINLQLASDDTVVVSWVTFEELPPAGLPVVSFGAAASVSGTVVEGVTHSYQTAQSARQYWMHFVVLADLSPRTTYQYKVRSGGEGALWSAEFAFKAPYSSDSSGPTSVAIFGDMGVYSWNNMGNLLRDVEAGDIDLVVHIGDHAYNMNGDDGGRGDAYMQAYQPVLARVPWIPVVGNHEFYDGSNLNRYLNQTDGSVVGNPASSEHPWLRSAVSTADTALGSLISAGNHHGAGIHSPTTPSGTSRYFSVDLGLIHFVALDLNLYNGEDECGEPCRQGQLQWLKADLAAANERRDEVPWIVAMSHFPLYCSNCPAPGTEPGAWWNAEQCEFTGHDQSCVVVDDDDANPAVQQAPVGGATNNDMVPDFEPIFMQFGVDVYASGHIHDYEFIYPVYNNSAVQKDFNNPKAPVHLVTGNGGPPSQSAFGKIRNWSHLHSSVYSYTRMVAHNASTMEWIQVANNGSIVLDRLVVVQEKHGSFPIPT